LGEDWDGILGFSSGALSLPGQSVSKHCPYNDFAGFHSVGILNLYVIRTV